MANNPARQMPRPSEVSEAILWNHLLHSSAWTPFRLMIQFGQLGGSEKCGKATAESHWAGNTVDKAISICVSCKDVSDTRVQREPGHPWSLHCLVDLFIWWLLTRDINQSLISRDGKMGPNIVAQETLLGSYSSHREVWKGPPDGPEAYQMAGGETAAEISK